MVMDTITGNGTSKMKVEVWSDIMCPFCYIGKRNYEAALNRFANRGNVELVWKSFQLDPTIPQVIDKKVSVYQYLADRKGWSYEQSVKMHEGVVQTAKKAGLKYHFDKAVIANSFKAHRLIQMAKTKGLGDKAEERFFFAYFTEGLDLGNPDVLTNLGKDIGLTDAEVVEALANAVFYIQPQPCNFRRSATRFFFRNVEKIFRRMANCKPRNLMLCMEFRDFPIGFC